MPDVQHNTLSGAELHEPKGVDGASSNETYVADGAGSGAWAEPEPKGVSAASAEEIYVADGAGSGAWTAQKEILSATLDDVSSASGIVYIPIPYAGNVVKVLSVLEAGITGSDPSITVKDSSGATMGAFSITASGSAAGDVDGITSLSNNAVTDDDYMTIETDGASTGNVSLQLCVVIERT